MAESVAVNHCFVDEAGDLTLFDRRGRVTVGQDGVSRTFIVGVAQIADPEVVGKRLNDLRHALLQDPYFKDVPSMSPMAGKTARSFHAKDDVPEVRREVFRLLSSLEFKCHAAFRRKHELAVDASRRFAATGVKLRADDVYDSLCTRLFRDILHKAESNRVVFARRGKADRAESLASVIERAQRNFRIKWGHRPDRPTTTSSASPSESAGLQVVDYCLWALQRMIERGEDRFFGLLAPRFRLIMDLDDIRNRPYGEWYNPANPLTLEKMKPLAG